MYAKWLLFSAVAVLTGCGAVPGTGPMTPTPEMPAPVKSDVEPALDTVPPKRIEPSVSSTPVATEEGKIEEAERACQKIESRCQTACVAGNQFSCVAWARTIWPADPARYAQARNIMEHACGKGIEAACTATKKIDADMEAYEAETEAMWGEAADAADSIAMKRWQIRTMKGLPGKKNAKGLAMMELHVGAVVVETYCPAKKAFVGRKGIAEFRHRAEVYCENSAPTVTGLSGSQIELRAECREAFASPCS